MPAAYLTTVEACWFMLWNRDTEYAVSLLILVGRQTPTVVYYSL